MKLLEPAPLTAEAFSPYGEVIAVPEGGAFQNINDDTCRRYDALARIDVVEGVAGLSIFRAVARSFPFAITLLERHPLGSQAFMPLGAARFIVVVAGDDGGAPDWQDVRAFAVQGQQGINFHRNVWHHPLIAVGATGDFLVADRLGGAENLQEVRAPVEIGVVAP